MSSNMMSHLVGGKETSLKNITVSQLFDSAVEQYPSNIAIVSCKQDIVMTYEEFNNEINALAKGFISIGLNKGDRIGIWSPNNSEWVTTMYAAAKAGLILVNINPAYRPAELEYALNKVACKAIVLAKQFKTSDYVEMIRTICPEVNDCAPGQLESEKLPLLKSLIVLDEEHCSGFYNYHDMVLAGASIECDFLSISQQTNPNDPVNIQFTSGTTGAPKGATLTHNNIVNNAYFVGRGIGLSQVDKICTPVPLYHCMGMVMSVLACSNFGATLVLPDESFDPVSTLQAIQQEQCTALYGVPTMFSMIVNHPDLEDYSLESLRTGIVAGALCPEVLMGQIVNDLNMHEITNCYGMTETSPVSFQSAMDEGMEKRTTTVGQVHPNVEVKVVDEEGMVVPRGERGELCTKGYSVMQGYWNDPQKTQESIVDGWMHTGDQAVIDPEGYCSIVGRIKDTIIRGGENIAPKEIEEYLLSHSDIIEAQAFGVKDEKFGEIVVAWVKLIPQSTLTEEGVRAYCKNQIAHFKVPAIVRFVDEYPMTVTGKIQKYVMREKMEAELNQAQSA